MTEEVEVKVHDVVENGKDASSTFVEGLRKLLLAGIGAVALSRDETESFVNKLVERGELAQKDAEKLLREVQSRLRKNTNGVEQGMEDFLNRLNIPSKRDIDELSAKIAQLAVRIEELRKQK